MADTDLNGPLIPEKRPKIARAPRQKKDIMPAVKKEAGQGGRKKASEIVQQYLLQQTGDQRAVAAYMNSLASLIRKRISRLIQFGNTVFMCTQKGPRWIDVHIFTEDSPKTMVHRIQQAYGWAKQHGFAKVTSTLTDGNMVQVVKMAGLPYSVKQTQVNDGKQMRPAYELTMEVK